MERVKRNWCDVPAWAHVELRHKDDPTEIVYAESRTSMARAWPSVFEGNESFSLIPDMWEVIGTRPVLLHVPNLTIGEEVLVTNAGLNYTTFSEAFDATGLNKTLWAKGQSLSGGEKATFLGRLERYKHLGVLTRKGMYYLVGMGGFEKLKDSKASENTPSGMLQEAAECLKDRASERDSGEERSMVACVKAFNEMYGKDLTEEEGWMFMAMLKMSRAKGGNFRRDDYVDGAAYFALAGESASKDRG